MARRAVIREKCPDRYGSYWRELRASGAIRSLGIAAVFCALAIAIVMLREDVVPYRPGQYAQQDIRARVDFTFHDKNLLAKARQDVRDSQPRVYKTNADVWGDLEKRLLTLPQRLAGKKLEEVDQSLRNELELEGNTGALSEFSAMAASEKEKQLYEKQVKEYVAALSKGPKAPVILSEKDYRDELESDKRRHISIPPEPDLLKEEVYPVTSSLDKRFQDLVGVIKDRARVFASGLKGNRIVAYTINTLQPTHVLDAEATVAMQNAAADRVWRSKADQQYKKNQVIVPQGTIADRDWQVLKVEKEAYITSLGRAALKGKFGLSAIVVLLTGVMSYYIGRFQPRIVRNPARAVAIGALLLSMLLLAQLAAIGTGPLYTFGVAPTIVVAMILAIAYDQRFAIGIATMHAILVTAALDQGIGFFLIIWVGVLTCGFMLDEIRTRIKLIEIGGTAAIVMIFATIATGAAALDHKEYIAQNCLYTGAAGLSVGFIVLGILPFIEKTFRITTGMTLLELADASQPLLRRLALEAPGTYNHSLQVATLAEAAAEAVGANSLRCRVAAYYHDIGKINKADYFIENQTDGRNRHIHLTPNMSLHIIIGHVKDGMALAKEYNLPAEILPFIQQHHGTTLVEYFYDKARKQQGQNEQDGPQVSEMQFKYPGPKPKNKEIAILMLADAAESASRTLEEPTATSISRLVHDLMMRRLLDGQFDESDVTMRQLELIERALVKALTGIYHGRIAYPSSEAPAQAKRPPESETASGMVA